MKTTEKSLKRVELFFYATESLELVLSDTANRINQQRRKKKAQRRPGSDKTPGPSTSRNTNCMSRGFQWYFDARGQIRI
jgi:hypothetical protein